MRFLFGLIIGAVLTLFVASAFNVPTHALVEKGKTSWDGFLLATGDALFEFPQVPEAEPVSDVVVEMQGLDMDADMDIDVHPPAATVLPVATASEPMGLDALIASQETPAAIQSEVVEPMIALEEPAVVEPVAAAESVDATGLSVIDADVATQTVWVPFRSQMSAQGFARRLTGKLDYPFSVNRQGPGRYQVTFSYASEYERLAVLDQVQSVTGEETQ